MDQISLTDLTFTAPEGDPDVVPERKAYLQGPSVMRTKSVMPSSLPMKVQPISPKLPPAGLRDESTLANVPLPVHRPNKPIHPDEPDRYPTPPPFEDLEGPAAVYPYLSADKYSCRPGGPRLFDILNELPLDRFGLMTWIVLEREEEIFEQPDIRDEDKVMHALWGRYILLNRCVDRSNECIC